MDLKTLAEVNALEDRIAKLRVCITYSLDQQEIDEHQKGIDYCSYILDGIASDEESNNS